MGYKEEHGDCNVPQSMGGLGDWVFNQRIAYTKGSLSRERVGRLEDIGYTWRFVATDRADVLIKLRYWEELWDWRYRELKQYRDEHGDCNVPESQGGLGKWVSRRRGEFKAGKLSDERIARLDSIGFVWDMLEQEWLDRFNELTDYKAENGDCNVPQCQDSLGRWVSSRREEFKAGKLSDERIARLDSIGFAWDLNEQEWLDRLDELTNYKAARGDCNVPMSQGSLGEWVGNQRQSYKKGRMSQERVDLLESIGFGWEPLDEAWMARFDELFDYKTEQGDCNVPQSQGPLGEWVITQRKFYKKGKLSQERIKLLESIGFEWVLVVRTHIKPPRKLNEQWKTKFTELVLYLIEHGNCNVPKRYGPLGGWVGTQRASYKDGSMPQFRIDYLDSIGFAWKLKRVAKDCSMDEYSKPDPMAIAGIIEEESQRYENEYIPSSARRCLAEALQAYLDSDTARLIQTYDKPQKIGVKWQTRYTELVHYFLEHGNCNVPTRYGTLGWWVSKQRKKVKYGNIMEINKEYLESIGFAWTTKRVGNQCHPEQYSRPDPKAIARIIEDKKPRNDLPHSAPEGLRMRVKADRDLVEALQECLNKIENSQ